MPRPTRYAVILSVLILSISGCSSQKSVDRSSNRPASNVRVMAHYMPWFQRETTDSDETIWKHWQWFGKGKKHDPDSVIDGRHDIASVFYPKIGPYDCHDVDVIEYHILTAKLAGIEAFMCNWYGPGSFTDQSVSKMLPIAEKYGFKIGICMEEKAFFPPYSSAEDREGLVKEMARQVSYILETHGKSDAFLKHDGLPLLFVFNGHGEGALGSNNLAATEIDLAKSLVDTEILLVRNDIDAKQFPASDGGYIWCAEKDVRDRQYEAVTSEKQQGKIQYAAAVASPGFDDSGVQGWGNLIRKLDRRGTDEFQDNWNEAIASSFDAIQIATWNDFEEGTTIEPTVEYGFTFVDQSERQIEKVTGRRADVSDNKLGLEVYELRKSVNGEFSEEIDAIANEIAKGNGTSALSRIEALKIQLQSE